MGRNRKSILIALALVSAMTAPAAAQSRRARAIKRFQQAEAYFKAGAYDRAIVEYQAAHALVPKPGLLFNIGLSYENLGDAERAVEFYGRYLAGNPDGAKVEEARARAEALRRRLEADRQERARAAAREKRAADRAAAIDRRRGRAARLIAAGRHGAAVAELRALFALSRDPEVVFQLAEARRASGDRAGAVAHYRRYLGLAGAAAHRADAARRIDELGPDRAARPRPSLVPGLIVLGGAAALGGAGLLFQLEAARVRDELDADLRTGTPPLDSRDPRLDEGKRAAVTSAVLFGLGGAALVTGAVLTTRAILGRRASLRVVVEPPTPAGRAILALEWPW